MRLKDKVLDLAKPKPENPLVQTWFQVLRERKCKKSGHMFYVGPGGYYSGMPQSHCWRCGKADEYGYLGKQVWIVPLSL